MSDHRYGGVSDQAKAVRQRLADAEVLLAGERWRGAMYLAGYVVECALKHRLMGMHGCQRLSQLERTLQQRGLIGPGQSVFTHVLDTLMRATGRMGQLRADHEARSRFSVVNQWVPAWRYSPDVGTREKAARFVEAVRFMVHWIDVNI